MFICLPNLSNLKLCKNWTGQKLEYFKKFKINNNQIKAATKEVFCEKDVLKLLAISLKITHFFIVSFIGDFSVRNHMQQTIFLIAVTETTAIFAPVPLHLKFLKQTIHVPQC